MRGPNASIGRILAQAYQAIGGSQWPASDEPLLAEVTRIIGIYAEGMKVQSIDVISTDVCGLVLTEETAEIEAASKTWRGIHRWCFEAGRCTKFEVYGQTLVVIPPTGGKTGTQN